MNRWHRDYGFEARMFMTMFMLAAVYLLFLYALWIFGGFDTFSLIFIAGIMLCITAGLPKPKIAIVESSV